MNHPRHRVGLKRCYGLSGHYGCPGHRLPGSRLRGHRLYQAFGRFVQNLAAGLIVFSATLSAHAEFGPEDVYAQLDARWYEIELIVFERLPVLNFNSPEDLVYQRQRAWPANIRDLLTEPAPTRNQAIIDEALEILPNPRCLASEPALPLHPAHQTRALLGAETENELRRWIVPQVVEPEGSAGDGQPVDEQAPGVTDLPLDSIADSTAATEALDPANIAQAAFTQALADYELELEQSAFTLLDSRQLVPAVKAINRQNHLRPLIHERWRQVVPARDAPEPVRIATDGRTQTLTGLHKVEGFIDITVSRYLHASVELWYHADNLGERPRATAIPEAGSSTQASSLQLAASDSSSKYMQLKESRRMRSTELHYIDHPKLGIVIRIDPVTPPDDLVQQWSALQDVLTE